VHQNATMRTGASGPRTPDGRLTPVRVLMRGGGAQDALDAFRIGRYDRL